MPYSLCNLRSAGSVEAGGFDMTADDSLGPSACGLESTVGGFVFEFVPAYEEV